jgi:hypothetical protein
VLHSQAILKPHAPIFTCVYAEKPQENKFAFVYYILNILSIIKLANRLSERINGGVNMNENSKDETINEDPIRKYSDAVREFEQSYENVRKLGDIVAEVGKYMNQKPLKMMVTKVSVGFPVELAIDKIEFTLNAEEWPNATQIAQTLVDLQAKASLVRSIWGSLSETDRNIVKGPDLKG